MATRRNTEVTGKRAASAASKVLRSPTASKAAKSAAGSALTQVRSKAGVNEVTSKRVASAASKTLRNPNASKAAKSAAGSALTQRPGRKR